MADAGAATRSLPPANTSGQDEAQSAPAATDVDRPLSRISRPMASASVTEPPGVILKTVPLFAVPPILVVP